MREGTASWVRRLLSETVLASGGPVESCSAFDKDVSPVSNVPLLTNSLSHDPELASETTAALRTLETTRRRRRSRGRDARAVVEPLLTLAVFLRTKKGGRRAIPSDLSTFEPEGLYLGTLRLSSFAREDPFDRGAPGPSVDT